MQNSRTRRHLTVPPAPPEAPYTVPSSPPIHSRRQHWTRPLVSTALYLRETQGEPLSPYYLHKHEPSLWWAARRHFGTIEAAYEASGISYKGACEYRHWDRETIFRRLRHHAAEIGSVPKTGYLEKNDPTLLAAIYTRFEGGLTEALILAGLTEQSCRPCPRTTCPAALLAELRCHLDHRPGSLRRLQRTHPDLVTHLFCHFPDWASAIEAARALPHPDHTPPDGDPTPVDSKPGTALPSAK